ncbi:hypothetical protein KHS38_17315 [Mucilaginibacter sp. Bleaf8]|uniref:LamG domain-containing protein n=1 Tax=Mucilaginibacter sp. Bleaf8 TaxID=2834430 RepID=UPI001BCEFCAB|nr:LamG domain-containing protein [Mucilaginibacter sp. Bleaf8]MBS7566171.1 hypothetical protein [Mucilaginibacter sp. Bleaf8]
MIKSISKAKLIQAIGVALLFTLGFSSCQKDGTLPEDISKIVLGKDTLTMYAGDVVDIDYKITPSNYDTTLLVWSVSDTSVVSINKGKATAKKEGLTTVTVKNTANTVSVSCVVKVIDALDKGLIAYWKFNGNNRDASGNKNKVTLYNISTVADRFGKANHAFSFNGYNSYLSVADNQALRLNNTNFTLNAWIKMDTHNNSYGSMILNKHLTGVDNGWTWSITGYASNPFAVGFFGPGGGSNNAYGSKEITLNGWHMVTAVYNVSTQRLSMYVDGVLDNVTNNVLSPNAAITTGLYIGRDNPSVNTNGYFYKGIMDDIRIYNRACNPTEIQRLFQAVEKQ